MSVTKTVQMVQIPENSYPMYVSIFNDHRIDSNAKVIMTKTIGLMNVSLNRGHTNNHFKDFYNYKDGYWYVKYTIDDIMNDTGMSYYHAKQGVAELNKYGYIEKKRTWRGYIWRLPKYEQYYTQRTPTQRPAVDNQLPQQPIISSPNRNKDIRNKDDKHSNTPQNEILRWKHTTAINLGINPEVLEPIIKFVETYHKPLSLLNKFYYVCFIQPRNYFINPKKHYINPKYDVDKSLAKLEDNSNFRANVGTSLSNYFGQIEANTKFNKTNPNRKPKTPNDKSGFIGYLVDNFKTDFMDWLDAKPKQTKSNNTKDQIIKKDSNGKTVVKKHLPKWARNDYHEKLHPTSKAAQKKIKKQLADLKKPKNQRQTNNKQSSKPNNTNESNTLADGSSVTNPFDAPNDNQSNNNDNNSNSEDNASSIFDKSSKEIELNQDKHELIQLSEFCKDYKAKVQQDAIVAFYGKDAGLNPDLCDKYNGQHVSDLEDKISNLKFTIKMISPSNKSKVGAK